MKHMKNDRLREGDVGVSGDTAPRSVAAERVKSPRLEEGMQQEQKPGGLEFEDDAEAFRKQIRSCFETNCPESMNPRLSWRKLRTAAGERSAPSGDQGMA